MAPVNSNGLIVHDSPLHHSLTLLLIQLLIIIAFSRILAVLLRPLRQPRVIAGKWLKPQQIPMKVFVLIGGH